MIIKVEKVLEELFTDIQLTGIDKLNFGYGDEKELDAIIIAKTMNNNKAYPLLWYKMPNEISNKPLDGYAEGSFTFILAHNTQFDWFNDQRFDMVYETVLYPYLEEILRLFKKSKRVMTEEDDYTTTNYPNYSKDFNKSEEVDYWDAIELKIDLKINNGINC